MVSEHIDQNITIWRIPLDFLNLRVTHRLRIEEEIIVSKIFTSLPLRLNI